MLEELLNFIHNYFEKEIHDGEFSISGGTLSTDFLQEGQYYRIVGSVFNDGVYQYPSEGLTDETFSGQVWAMAVPPAVIALLGEIESWQNKYGSAVSTPYQSESFGGYSYTKSTGGSSNGNTSPSMSWKDVFGHRLNHWRKIS